MTQLRDPATPPPPLLLLCPRRRRPAAAVTTSNHQQQADDVLSPIIASDPATGSPFRRSIDGRELASLFHGDDTSSSVRHLLSPQLQQRSHKANVHHTLSPEPSSSSSRSRWVETHLTVRRPANPSQSFAQSARSMPSSQIWPSTARGNSVHASFHLPPSARASVHAPTNGPRMAVDG
ncbi:hypothetical protein ACLOJK_040759 [Asimina triloba]